MKNEKIFDCITFYDENLLTNLRFEILNDVVDYFIVCESKFDHRGNTKPLNFSLLNKKYETKVRYLVLEEPFPNPKNGWACESYQREKIFDALTDASLEDYIFFSDSDEIPNPNELKNFSLKKKFAIFLQKFFVYKINVFNKFETPWEGTRACKKKYLKSFTHLRKKILMKNLSKSFWKFYLEKDIEIIKDGGWHFNNLYNFDTISKKLEAFPHKEYNSKKYSDIKIIEKKINNLEDLFDRGHKYEKIKLDNDYPKYILNNLDLFKDYIL